MSKSIQQLVTDANDFDLCNEVFSRVIDFYGDEIDASSLPDEHRVVLLAWHSMGIIENGGFNYLFEGSFDGDPQFMLTAEAFRAIECADAADSFQRALDLFPDSSPPADISRRLHIYRSGQGQARQEIDSQFWDARDSIERCLAAFIREHSEQFASLDLPNPNRRERAVSAQEPEPSGAGVDLSRLTHWARVALAARCARHVLSVFHLNWPDASVERRQSVENAIELAEQSAGNGLPDDGLDQAVLQAITTAGTALRSLYGFPGGDDETVPPDGNMATLACFAAKAAEKAAAAAQASPDESERFALEAFSFAQNAASGDEALIDPMWNDLQLLSSVAARDRWDDRTPVAKKVFDPSSDHNLRNRPWWKFW